MRENLIKCAELPFIHYLIGFLFFRRMKYLDKKIERERVSLRVANIVWDLVAEESRIPQLLVLVAIFSTVALE